MRSIRALWRFLRRRQPLLFGGGITFAMLAFAILSQFWTPETPTKMNIAARLRAPFSPSLLGTDHFGRDIASMLMVGAWNSLTIAFFSVAIGLIGGAILGAAAAALHGWFDEAIMRFADVIFSFPAVLSAIMIGALLGPGIATAVIAIGIFNIPVFARLTRGAALQIWTRDFVLAARAAGKGRALITLEHVLPNIGGLLAVQATIQLGLAILAEAGLSFLGIGISPPNPSWGRMLNDAQTHFSRAPHLAILPGLAIAVTVLGLNMLGDGLRDLIDPKLRRQRQC